MSVGKATKDQTWKIFKKLEELKLDEAIKIEWDNYVVCGEYETKMEGMWIAYDRCDKRYHEAN